MKIKIRDNQNFTNNILYEEKISTLGRLNTKVKSIIIKTKSNESFELFGLTQNKYDELILFMENAKISNASLLG